MSTPATTSSASSSRLSEPPSPTVSDFDSSSADPTSRFTVQSASSSSPTGKVTQPKHHTARSHVGRSRSARPAETTPVGACHPCPYPGCQNRWTRTDNLFQHFRTAHVSPDGKRNAAVVREAIVEAKDAALVKAGADPIKQSERITRRKSMSPDRRDQAGTHAFEFSTSGGTDLASPSASPSTDAKTELRYHFRNFRPAGSQMEYAASETAPPVAGKLEMLMHGMPEGAEPPEPESRMELERQLEDEVGVTLEHDERGEDAEVPVGDDAALRQVEHRLREMRVDGDGDPAEELQPIG